MQLDEFMQQWLQDRVTLPAPIFTIEERGIVHGNKAAFALELEARVKVKPEPTTERIVAAYTIAKCAQLQNAKQPYVVAGPVPTLERMRARQKTTNFTVGEFPHV